MFKTLVIIDYIILNGVSAFIDLFRENFDVFHKVAISKEYIRLTNSLNV
jgi:hypothetical protein